MEKKRAITATDTLDKGISTTLASPIELLRTRFQSQQGAAEGYRSVIGGIVRNTHESGIRTLWRGLGPSLWRDVPFSAIYWFCYEGMKTATEKVQAESYIGKFPASFFCGGFAGFFSGVATTPFDVVKTRFQVLETADLAQQGTMPSTFGMLKKIQAEEGLHGLFRGLFFI